MSTNTTAQTEQTGDSKKESLGAFKTSTALFELFETASPDMSKAQLELMVRAREHAELEAENLSAITEMLGLLVADDKNDGWDFKRVCPQLLWQLSYQFDSIAGMLQLAESAEYQLKELEQSSTASGEVTDRQK